MELNRQLIMDGRAKGLCSQYQGLLDRSGERPFGSAQGPVSVAQGPGSTAQGPASASQGLNLFPGLRDLILQG